MSQLSTNKAKISNAKTYTNNKNIANIKQYASTFFNKISFKTQLKTTSTPALTEDIYIQKSNPFPQKQDLCLTVPQSTSQISFATDDEDDDEEIPTPYSINQPTFWPPKNEYLEPIDMTNRKNSVVSFTFIKSKDNQLNRMTSTRSYSSNFSMESTSSSSLKSQSLLGRSKSRKKESKAIEKWQSTVHDLSQKKATGVKVCKKNTERDEALARFILHEFHSTERSFYHFLMYIQKNYMEPMMLASKVKNSLVKRNDVYLLFNYLPELISTSEKLLCQLEAAVQDKMSPGEAISRIFKEMESDFAVYLKYAIHYQDKLKSIRKASNHSFITKTEAFRNDYYRLGLSDYLIAPFQRIPRYELLLKDLLKHTTQKKDELLYAKNVIHGLAATMNHLQEKNSLFSSYSFP